MGRQKTKRRSLNIIQGILLVVNIMCSIAQLACAYSIYLNPIHFPNWSWLGLLFPIPLIANICFVMIWVFINKKYILISLFAILCCTPQIRTYCPINIFQTPPNKQNHIKILSYNVMYFDFIHHKEDLKDNEAMQYILNSDADIICLQEAKYYDKTKLISLLKTKYDYVYKVVKSSTSICVASRLPVVDTLSIKISDYSNQCFISKILLNGDTLTLLNNHLESYKLTNNDKQKYKDIFHNLSRQQHAKSIKKNFSHLEKKLVKANQIRAIQADMIDDYIAHCTTKYIIACGDFNDCSLSYVHQRLTNHLNDAYTISGNGPGLSYHRSGMYFRIDNILVSDTFHPFKATIDKSITLSDHYPIFCTLYF